MKTPYALQQNLAKNVVLIDGITRCGKSMLTNIVPSFERMEHIQFYTLLEMITSAVAAGDLDANLAKSIIRTHMNELAYNTKLSRCVNFRYTDQSGVINFRDPKVYYERLTRPEGDDVTAELLAGSSFFPFQTHNIMANLNSFLKLELDFLMLAMFRHPVDNIYSWWTRGWGERFGKDPRDFTLTLSYHTDFIPWHCREYPEKWLSMNAMERCILAASDLIQKSVRQYIDCGTDQKIHIYTFEDFSQNPDAEIEKICRFLGTKPTLSTGQFVHKAKCPRKVDLKDRERKYQEFKSAVSGQAFALLTKMTEAYESNLYGIRSDRPCIAKPLEEAFSLYHATS